MKLKNDHNQICLSILTGLLLTSSGALAGEITSDFIPGGVITATQMTEIKDAVNDNDTNVINIQGAVTDNTTAITNIQSAVTDNDTDITNIQNAVSDIDTVIARLFGGDGSAGDLIVSASLDWETSPPANPYFNNITIDAGQTLTVPAGTTMRCRGDFINNGTLSVATSRNGGSHTSNSPRAEAITAPHPGDSIRAAGTPASTFVFSFDTPFLAGGLGGRGISRTKALTSYNQFQYGGGGGSGHRKEGTNGNGGDGGGLVKINCNGTITNNGLIEADASTSVSGGGGGGGIVILASLTEINNAATISANGGDGEPAGIDHGNAGGGGGGIIVMIAPSIPDSGGATSVLGGTAASIATPISRNASTGGGGGAASGGDGGDGGSVASNAVPAAGSDGSAGYVIQILATPSPY